MPPTTTTPDPKTLTLAHVHSAYSGRPGCCCGCRGEHRETERARKAMLKRVQDAPGDWTYSDGLPGCGGHYFHQTDTRLNILYLRPQ